MSNFLKLIMNQLPGILMLIGDSQICVVMIIPSEKNVLSSKTLKNQVVYKIDVWCWKIDVTIISSPFERVIWGYSITQLTFSRKVFVRTTNKWGCFGHHTASDTGRRRREKMKAAEPTNTGFIDGRILVSKKRLCCSILIVHNTSILAWNTLFGLAYKKPLYEKLVISIL